MTILSFLGWWALRSSAVVILTAGFLKLFRVQSPSVRLASWTTALFASILLPLLAPALPAVRLPLPVVRVAQPSNVPLPSSMAASDGSVSPSKVVNHAPRTSQPFAWPALVLSIYGLGAGLLLLRAGAGVVMTRRILGRSVATGLLADGRPILESRDLTIPAAVGVLRPAVVLPSEWREWETAKLDAVLIHELSHVRRRDPALHLLSAAYRAALWFSPASWWMHDRIVRLAEDASDDAVMAVTPDRVSYAELLLQFMQRPRKRSYAEGVTMARYGRAEARIRRILDSTLSRGLTRVGVATILGIALPAVFLAAAVTPAPQAPQPASVSSPRSAFSSFSQQPAPSPAPLPSQPSQAPLSSPAPIAHGRGLSQAVATATPASAPASPQSEERETRYLIVDGESMSGSWDSRDEPQFKKWRSHYGDHFAWFRRNGQDYIVTDETVLGQLRDAMGPQKEVNAKQAEVNLMQADVNLHQGKVNRLQGGVNDAQANVNKEQDKVNRLDAEAANREDSQSRVNRMQDQVNAQQSEVNSQQDVVNREQAGVNAQQAVVNRMQDRASQAIERSIHRILDDVMSKGLAEAE